MKDACRRKIEPAPQDAACPQVEAFAVAFDGDAGPLWMPMMQQLVGGGRPATRITTAASLGTLLCGLPRATCVPVATG